MTGTVSRRPRSQPMTQRLKGSITPLLMSSKMMELPELRPYVSLSAAHRYSILIHRSRLRQRSRSLRSMGFHWSYCIRLLAESKYHRLLYVPWSLLPSFSADTSDVPFATSSFGEHTIIGTIGVINGVLNGVSQPFIAKVCLIPQLQVFRLTISRLPTCGPDPILSCWQLLFMPSVTPCALVLRTSPPLSLGNSFTLWETPVSPSVRYHLIHT